jgi:lysophospholipase L1-like esterase
MKNFLDLQVVAQVATHSGATTENNLAVFHAAFRKTKPEKTGDEFPASRTCLKVRERAKTRMVVRIWRSIAILILICGSISELAAAPFAGGDMADIYRRSIVSNGCLARIHHFIEKMQKDGTVTLGIIGGSITQGAKASAPENRYANRVAAWLREQFPKTGIKLVNAGIGGTGSKYGCLRAQDDLLQYHPDLVIIEFSVNDSFLQKDSLPAYEGLVRQVIESKSAIILLFTMTSKAPGVKNLDKLIMPGTEPIIMDGSLRGLNVQHWHSKVGQHYNLPMLSYRDAAWPEIAAGRISWEDLMADQVHPNDAGHKLIADLITDWLGHVIKNLDTQRPLATDAITRNLPKPLVSDRFHNVKYTRSGDLKPVLNSGWRLDSAKRSGKEWVSDRHGDEIQFKVQGTGIAVVLAQSIKQGGTAELCVDDGRIVRQQCSNPQWALPIVVDLGDGLPSQSHTVTVKVSNTGPAGPIRILGVASTGL